MTILITGATGFLGSYLLKNFIQQGYEIIALKRSTSNTYRINNHIDKCIVYNIDTISIFDIFKNHSIDVVINTVTDYGRKKSTISSVLNTNLIFSLNLLEATINAKVKSFINTDTLLTRNINAYALSKAQLVDWMKFFSQEETTMINIKIEHMYGLQDDENKFIHWLQGQLEKNVAEIDLTSGKQKRDFIYIDDIVHAYQIIIQNREKLTKFEEFELGTGNSIEVKKFIKLIYDELSSKQRVTTQLNFGVIPYRAEENMNMVANISELKKLGWFPETTLENGIKKIVQGETL